MHQIGKSHAGCIIKVVLASSLSLVSCASFPNVEDRSGCTLTLINLAAHHDKPGVWWEMAKSTEESARHQTTKVWVCCHRWSWFSTKVAEKTVIPQIRHSSKPGWHPEKRQPTNAPSVSRMMPTSRSLGAMRTSDHLRYVLLPGVFNGWFENFPIVEVLCGSEVVPQVLYRLDVVLLFRGKDGIKGFQLKTRKTMLPFVSQKMHRTATQGYDAGMFCCYLSWHWHIWLANNSISSNTWLRLCGCGSNRDEPASACSA